MKKKDKYVRMEFETRKQAEEAWKNARKHFKHWVNSTDLTHIDDSTLYFYYPLNCSKSAVFEFLLEQPGAVCSIC